MNRKYEKQKKGFTKVPKYIWNAMQGLAYWIGYKKRLYQYYSLSESAIVTEFCSLLQAGLNNNEIVLCERQYRNFFNKVPKELKRCRMDVTVAEISEQSLITKKDLISNENKKKDAFLKEIAKVVFEVKLLDSPKSLKEIDFESLKKVKDNNGDVVTYFLLVSEDKIPCKFVNTTTGIALDDSQLDYDRNKYKLHVSKVKCVLDSKIRTDSMKKIIKDFLGSSGNIEKKINEQLDKYMKRHFSKGVFVCLIEVV